MILISFTMWEFSVTNAVIQWQPSQKQAWTSHTAVMMYDIQLHSVGDIFRLALSVSPTLWILNHRNVKISILSHKEMVV